MLKNKLTSRYLRRLTYMATALVLASIIGNLYKELAPWIDSNNIGEENLFLNILFITILYTPFARVNYCKINHVREHVKPTILLMFSNWILGPLLFFFFIFSIFKNEPQYIVGLVLICIARSKSDILYLNKTFSNNMDYTDGVVALNTLVQVLSYTLLTWTFLCFIPMQLNGEALMDINYIQISEKVAIYIGIPFILGLFSRLILSKLISPEWFNKIFIKASAKISFFAVVILCFCITILKIQNINSLLESFYRIALPLILYFILQYIISSTFKSITNKKKGDSSSLQLTGIIHNFRIALIIAISLFGINSLVVEVILSATLIEFIVILVFSNLYSYQRKKKSLSK